jgi:hypothetical protein
VDGFFILARPLNYFGGPGVSNGEPSMFRRLARDETNLRRNETIFYLREGIRKRALAIN